MSSATSESPSYRQPETETGGSPGPLRGQDRFGGLGARDLGFATLVAALLALSPTTGAARLVPSLVLGALGGGLVLWLRRGPRPHTPPPSQDLRQDLRLLAPSPTLAVVALALLLASGPTLVWLYGEYTDSVWHNLHGLFVPLFMVLAARSELRRDPHPERQESSAWGFAWVGAAAGLWWLDAGVGSRFLSTLALIVALPGVCLVLLGARRTRRLAFPLALGIFLLPLPEQVGDPLGIVPGTTTAVQWIAELLGIPVIRDGVTLHVGGVPFEVSENCSGFAILHAAIAFGAMLAGLGGRRHVALLITAVGLTLALNTVRCLALMLAGAYALGMVDSALHGLSGLAVFWAVIAALWLLCDRRAVRERLA